MLRRLCVAAMKLGTLGGARPMLARVPPQPAFNPSPRLPALLGVRAHSSLEAPSTLLPQAAVSVAPSTSAAYAEPDPQYTQEPVEIGEVDWRLEYVNSVALIGNLGIEFDVRHTPAGRPVARNRLAVKRADKQTDWVDIEVWGELAERAAANLRRGNQVQVLGRVRTEEFTDKVTQARRQKTKVVVATLDRVRPFSYTGVRPPAIPMQPDAPAEEQTVWGQAGAGAGAPAVDQPGGEVWPTNPSAPQGAAPAASSEDKWRRFFADPSRYWDNRFGKRNERQPDFKHKDTGEALWISDRYAPLWVAAELERAFPSSATSAEPSDTNPY